jgi:beta-exotoxin I transport system permease protein
MRIATLLVVHSLKRVRILLLTTGLLLGAFQLVLIFVAGSIQASGGFDQLATLLPGFFRELLGPALASFMSFSGIVSVGYFHLTVIGALMAVAVTLATIPTAEVESGFSDFILSRPVARHWVITRTIVVTALGCAFVVAVMVAGTWGGLHAFGRRDVQWPSVKLVSSLAENLYMLALCWGGVAMAIGAAARRRSVAGGAAGLLALGFYLLDYVGRLWQPAEKVAWLSPFRYYNPFELMLGNPLPPKNLIVLGAVALAGFFAAYVLYARRDISH